MICMDSLKRAIWRIERSETVRETVRKKLRNSSEARAKGDKLLLKFIELSGLKITYPGN